MGDFLLQYVTNTKHNQRQAFETYRERQCLLFHIYHNLKHYEYAIKSVSNRTLNVICAQCPAVLSIKLGTNIKTVVFKETTNGKRTRRLMEISNEVPMKELLDEANYEMAFHICIPKYCGQKCVSVHTCEGYEVNQNIKRQYRTMAIKLHKKKSTQAQSRHVRHCGGTFTCDQKRKAGWLTRGTQCPQRVS